MIMVAIPLSETTSLEDAKGALKDVDLPDNTLFAADPCDLEGMSEMGRSLGLACWRGFNR